MNYVPYFDLFGVDAKQIPCDTGSGAPTSSTEGAVGCLYMDTNTGDIYKCVSAANGVYEWKLTNSGSGSVDVENAVLYTEQVLTEGQKAQARDNIGAVDVDYVVNRLDTEKTERQAEIAVERSRITNLASLQEGSTTGDAELQDIRVGHEGTVYESAGEAVREQVLKAINHIPTVSTRNINDLVFENAAIDTSTGKYSIKTTGKNCAASSKYINVVGGESYTISWEMIPHPIYIYIHEYKSDYSYIKNNFIDVKKHSYITTTLDVECAYIRIHFYSNEDNSWEELIPNKLQIELGTMASTYIKPYLIDPNYVDYTPAEPIVDKKLFSLNSTVYSLLDNFVEGKEIAYSHGEKNIAYIGNRTDMYKFVGYRIPIIKSTLPSEVRGFTLFLEFNAPEMPVVLELYDQNQKFIKTLAEETITAYKIAGLESYDVYGTFHTFICEFYRSLITTDVAYLQVSIPNVNSTSIERLWVAEWGTIREEIDVSITPKYYSVVTNPNSWIEDMKSDGKGGYVNREDKTFIQILGKTMEVDSSKIKPRAFDYAAYGLPVLEFNGNIDNMNKDTAVTLLYKYGEREGSCTLKWQGSSSLAHPKKNYTVKFDTAFEAKEGWGEQKKYCLKANYIDFTHSRNIGCAKLWGGVVKTRVPENATLNALPNGGAIDGFPICLVINGEYKGIYTFNIPKDGWMFGMGNGDAEAILCADASARGACTFEALVTLDGDFDVEYAPDEDNTDWIKTSVNRLIQACIDSDGTDLDTTIAQYLDWESAIDYFVFCMLTHHFDGISKNYLLATYDGVKWFFSAYDMDSTFGLYFDGSKITSTNAGCTPSSLKVHKVFDLIIKYKADALKARYKEITNRWNTTVDKAWAGALSEDIIAEVFTNFAGSIPKALLDEEVKIWTALPSTSINNIAQILDFYRRKRAFVDPLVEAL